MEDTLAQYGAIGVFLIITIKALHMQYTDSRDVLKIQREDTRKMFEEIQDSNKRREDSMIEAMKEQAQMMREISVNVKTNADKLEVFEEIFKTMIEKGA